MADTLFFNGTTTATPTVASQINDSAMIPVSVTSGNTLAILGSCDGGVPQTIYSFGDPEAAQAALVSGPLLHAVLKSFAASNEIGASPGLVQAIRVDEAVAASSAAGAAGTGSYASSQPGILGNNVQVTVAPGSVSGLSAKIITPSGANIFQDNLSAASMTVEYEGTQMSATVAVTYAGGAPQLVLCAPAATVVATLPLSAYQNVAALAAAISAVPGFTATPAPGASLYPMNGGAGICPPVDPIAVTSCYQVELALTANYYALTTWFANSGQPYVKVTSYPYNITASTTFVLTGGTATPPVIGDWTEALGLLQTESVQHIVPLSGDPAIHAAVSAHCTYMSTTGKSERRGYVGPVQGTTLDEVLLLPFPINNDRIEMVWPGHYDFNESGVLTLYDSFYSAVLVAAGFASMNPGQSMTNKTITIQGLEFAVQNPIDTDQLILAGVTPLVKDTTGYLVCRAISTWLVNNAYDKVEVSCGIATDFTAINVRAALKQIPGNGGSPTILARAYSVTESILTTLAKPAPQGLGVLVGDATSPAFQGIVASLVGDQVAVNFQCSPVIPVNFVPVSISVVPYSGTASS